MSVKSDCLNEKTLNKIFTEIGAYFSERGALAEIILYGSGALLLKFPFKQDIHDVDYLPVSINTAEFTAVVSKVANKYQLAEDFMNQSIVAVIDDPKGLYEFYKDYPVDKPGLRIFTASPLYTLAMKVLSLRPSYESSDAEDVWHLIDVLGFKSCDDIRSVVSDLFPDEIIAQRNMAIVGDMLEAKEAGQNFSPIMAI